MECLPQMYSRKKKIKTFKYERQRLKICEKRDKNKGETQSSLSGTVMSNVLTGRKILNSPLSLYNTVCQCYKKIQFTFCPELVEFLN